MLRCVSGTFVPGLLLVLLLFSGAALANQSLEIPGGGGVMGSFTVSNQAPYAGLQGLVAGSYNFRLTVTDSSGQSSSCTVHHGAVAADSRDVVVTGEPMLDALLGPQIRFGANPWPYFDDRHKDLADHFGGLQATHPDVWNNLRTGTVSITQGTNTLTGSGTSFLSDFACNGTDHVVIEYPYAPAGGITSAHHWRSTVTACASDTDHCQQLSASHHQRTRLCEDDSGRGGLLVRLYFKHQFV